jgi:thymidine phosphorylase
MVASILSKKAAAGVTHLVLDLPVGPTAKLRSPDAATELRKLFEYVADAIGLTIEVVFTDGSQPIGNGVGPALEARDVMAVLRNEADAPADLRDKSLLLAARMLEFDPALRGGGGLARARHLLASGAALEAMQRIMAAQGPPPAPCEPAPLTMEIKAERGGIVAGIDCLRLARIARLAGAPFVKGAGIDLLAKTGAPVAAGQPLYRLHAGLASDLGFALNYALADNAYRVHP